MSGCYVCSNHIIITLFLAWRSLLFDLKIKLPWCIYFIDYFWSDNYTKYSGNFSTTDVSSFNSPVALYQSIEFVAYFWLFWSFSKFSLILAWRSLLFGLNSNLIIIILFLPWRSLFVWPDHEASLVHIFYQLFLAWWLPRLFGELFFTTNVRSFALSFSGCLI